MKKKNEMKLLFSSFFSKFYFDGKRYYEEDESPGSDGTIKRVTRKRVEKLAKVNSAEESLPKEA